MFEDLLDPATCGEISRAQMVTAIRQYHRLQATMAARTWAFVAMLLRDHEDDAAAAEQQHWAHDAWAAARDQIGPAMSLSPRRASGQMRLAEALAVRLPEVAALLEHGMISAQLAATIVYRTQYVDSSAQPVVDAQIADRAGGLSTLSETDLEMAIDAVVEEHDPDAVRRYRDAAKNCDVQVGKRDDATGTTSLYGRISDIDADLSVRILNAYADTVCKHDPRSRGQLRAAAYGAVFRRHDRLVCLCGNPTCVAATIPSKVESVIVHVLAEHATLEAALADVAAAQHFPPADNAAPTVDFETLIRDADQHTTTAQPPTEEKPPWERPSATAATEAGGDGDGSEVTDTAPEDESPWVHWITPAPDDDGDDEDPPWVAKAAPGPGSGSGNPEEALSQPDSTPDHGGDEDPPSVGATSPEPTLGPDDPHGGGAAAVPDVEQPVGRSDSTGPAQTSEGAPAANAGQPDRPTRVRPAVTLTGAVIPTGLLADLIRTGVTVTALPIPTEEPRTGYQFTGTLRDFVQCRDMRCRFPGCNRRAEYADIDHTIPDGDGGPTHASNGKVLCREHHLLKTFRSGPDGWADEQLPTGDVIWRSPTGHEYLTEPSTRLVFPDWNPETAKLPPPKRRKRRKADAGLTMPTRKRTREQDRQQHIKTERDYNAAQRALGEDRAPPRDPF